MKTLLTSKYTKNYLIQSGTDTIYFEYNITTLNEYLLSKPLTINLSLSTTNGIILYYLDENKNQFILSVNDLIVPTINIEFNGRILIISLSNLCRCVKCTNEPLIFDILINDVCKIKCNGNEVTMANEQPKIINHAYPVFQLDSTCKARLWLVNTPQYGNLYPSNNQLSGCINDIHYGLEPINIKKYGNLPDERCTSQCDKTLCNGGICIENYGIHPICNCSNKFEKGKYCNESIKLDKETKRIVHNANFMIKKTSISWNGNSSKIFTASSDSFSIRIYSNETYLKFQFEDRTENLIKVSANLMKNYTNNVPNSLIIWFEGQMINAKFNNSLSPISIPINYNLANEIFHTIEIQGPSAYVILFSYLNIDNWNYLNINSLQYTDEQIFEPRVEIEGLKNNSILIQQPINLRVYQYALLTVSILIFAAEIFIYVKIFGSKLICYASGSNKRTNRKLQRFDPLVS